DHAAPGHVQTPHFLILLHDRPAQRPLQFAPHIVRHAIRRADPPPDAPRQRALNQQNLSRLRLSEPPSARDDLEPCRMPQDFVLPRVRLIPLDRHGSHTPLESSARECLAPMVRFAPTLPAPRGSPAPCRRLRARAAAPRSRPASGRPAGRAHPSPAADRPAPPAASGNPRPPPTPGSSPDAPAPPPPPPERSAPAPAPPPPGRLAPPSSSEPPGSACPPLSGPFSHSACFSRYAAVFPSCPTSLIGRALRGREPPFPTRPPASHPYPLGRLARSAADGAPRARSPLLAGSCCPVGYSHFRPFVLIVYAANVSFLMASFKDG